MKKFYFFTAIFISFLQIHTFAQVKFDVKTSLSEKEEFKFIKLALINSLNQSNWATVKEIREDYSAWLTNLKRYDNGSSIITEYDLDLRTPAELSRSKEITSQHISVEFDTTGIYNVKTPNKKFKTYVDTILTNLLMASIIKIKIFDEISKLLLPTSPHIAAIVIATFLANKMVKKLTKPPTPFEILESNLLAAKTMVELKKMVKD
jgi:hypothetical protein